VASGDPGQRRAHPLDEPAVGLDRPQLEAIGGPALEHLPERQVPERGLAAAAAAVEQAAQLDVVAGDLGQKRASSSNTGNSASPGSSIAAGSSRPAARAASQAMRAVSTWRRIGPV